MTKQQIILACHQLINKRLDDIREALDASREAANSESKSSAGDKYETTRAMMHLEQDKLNQQLAETLRLKEVLFLAENALSTQKAGLGSLIQTKSETYFIGAGLGKIIVAGQVVFAVSPASPVGQLLMGKMANDNVNLPNKTIVIESIL